MWYYEEGAVVDQELPDCVKVGVAMKHQSGQVLASCWRTATITANSVMPR